jgi:hypothetical protein
MGPAGRCALWTICGPEHQRRQRPPATSALKDVADVAVIAVQGRYRRSGVKWSRIGLVARRLEPEAHDISGRRHAQLSPSQARS